MQLAGALAALAAVAEVLIADGPLGSIYGAYLFPAVGALYVVTGLVAWSRRPANRLGSLMTACGAAIIVTSYANTALPAFVAVGAVTATLPLSVLLHLVHACPSGVVAGRTARVTVAAGYVAGLVLQVPIWAFTPESPPFDVLQVSPRADLAATGADVQKWFGVLVLVTTVSVLVRRLREYSRAQRWLLASLLGFALLAVLMVAVGGDVLPSLDLGVEEVADVQLAAVALVPLGFLLVVLRGGFVPATQLAAFAGPIGSAPGAPDAGPQLDRAVSAALGDPSAVVLRAVDGGYVDAYGRAAPAPGGRYRAVARIGGADAPLGALVHDTALDTDPAILAGVTQVAAIALDRERLAGAVTVSRAALQDASQRVLLAADAERRRIARDLHDGVQGALVLAALRARDLARVAHDDEAGAAATRLADGIDGAATALRDLVHGVLPAPLVERGLVAAVTELAEDLPIGVTVTAYPAELALPTPVETTAYFVIAEAVTNLVKHAHATSAEIALTLDDEVLTIDVVDDGVGAESYDGGSGAAGLQDRLAILGGTIEISRLDAGTQVRARVPCVS